VLISECNLFTCEYISIRLELEVNILGVFDSLRFVPLPETKPTLDLDGVEIRVHAFRLNFKDIVIALDRLPWSTLGCECAGIFIKVGSNARLKLGVRVMMAQNGYMTTMNRYQQDLWLKSHHRLVSNKPPLSQ
jgi:NADPH:quinone reductase-like Zn-dependent oxidoreductase